MIPRKEFHHEEHEVHEGNQCSFFQNFVVFVSFVVRRAEVGFTTKSTKFATGVLVSLSSTFVVNIGWSCSDMKLKWLTNGPNGLSLLRPEYASFMPLLTHRRSEIVQLGSNNRSITAE